MDPGLITLATATEDDCEFSYQVKKAATGEYIEAIWGWDETVQRNYHAKAWKEIRPDVIEYNGKPIGRQFAAPGRWPKSPI